MKRLPNGILPQFEQKTGIQAKFISAYLSDKDPVKPGRKRCILLEKASTELGYNFTASDWMFHPERIKAALHAPAQLETKEPETCLRS
ncbi:hypothetical protein [Desulfobacula sp.]|uniref:hypothetical protein n=1 Tax=Desulfobacula sp. TaxID=2593537 RepID=UPI00262EB7D0|nr:hypothetical protein [Desulfobacula sp.]